MLRPHKITITLPDWVIDELERESAECGIPARRLAASWAFAAAKKIRGGDSISLFEKSEVCGGGERTNGECTDDG